MPTTSLWIVTQGVLLWSHLRTHQQSVRCAIPEIPPLITKCRKNIVTAISPEIQSFLDSEFKKNPNLTSRSEDPKPCAVKYFHSIVTTPTPPLRERSRPLSAEKLNFLRSELQTLLDSGVIRRSSSPWAAPVHIVTKGDGAFRACGDYRRLNSVTVHDSYPMPLINDVLTRLPSSKIFSTFDLPKAYHQIPILQSDIPKTAIITPLGLFEYLRMPFGLRNASQAFQRHIDQILSDIPCVVAYVDDIIIGSPDETTHKEDLRKLLEVLNNHNLQVNLKKCQFFQEEVQFLGHLVSSNGIRPLPSRLETIRAFPKPETVTELRSLLGIINYCHCFIPNISSILSPLTALSQGVKRSLVKWTQEAEESFKSGKEALLSIQT